MSNNLDPDGVHSWLANAFYPLLNRDIIAGINDDDCAIVNIGNTKLVITTDYLNANPISKQLGFATLWDLGRLLVAANLSDLLGSGALPIGFLSSIMMEKGATKTDFSFLMEGIKFELSKYNIPLIGGDTKLGKSNAFCGTAIGIEEIGSKLFIKNQAMINQSILVSGNIGNVGAAVHGLSTKCMDEEWNMWAKKVLINPNLPLEKSRALSLKSIGSGGTDISDGLGENLYDMCESSHVGAHIYSSQIPLDNHVIQLAEATNIPPWFYAFSIGGDFQFIVTVNDKDTEDAQTMGYTKVGHTTSSTNLVLELEDKYYKLPRLGHTDFNTQGFAEEINSMMQNLKTNFS